MKFEDLKRKERHVQGLLALEALFSRNSRKRAKEFLILLMPLIVLALMFFNEEHYISENVLYGMLSLVIVLWLKLFMIDAFFYEYYFRGLKPQLHEWGMGDHKNDIPFEVLYLVAKSHEPDATKGFLRSSAGEHILGRLGISKIEIESFLKSDRKKIWANNLTFNEPVSLLSYAETVFDADKSFADFLFSRNIQREDFLGATSWVKRIIEIEKKHLRFWGRDALGRIKGIGKEWAYGETYNLQKHGYFVSSDQVEDLFQKETDELESSLAKIRESNALLISEETNQAVTVVKNLVARIEDGTVLPQIEHKKVFMLDDTSMSAGSESQADFEALCLKIFNEAVNAGNIILVFQNLPGFIDIAKARGCDIIDLLDPYLRSPNLQIIGISTKDGFAENLEKFTELTSRFEKIFIEGGSESDILNSIEDKAIEIERTDHLFFTHQAIRAIADGARRYFPGDVLADKALDLFDELVPNLVQRKINIVTKEHVDQLITSKTGIPTGEAKSGEKEKLLNLEKILHERVVGQDAAISAIASALRRSRSGITDSERPIGSFLFLGPTGVGKTETAKTLARVFFGAEDKMIRLDMSEYNTYDSLSRLIGSHETGKPGILAEILREKQYGVLLLDEFEKTTEEVHNLFLQVIDEGFFSDARGKRVNARNLIIIATSNAGSDYIWQLNEQGKNPADEKDSIVDLLIKNRNFKPELINRFDGVIVFHPLGSEHRERVAKILLLELHDRLKKTGVDLEITPELVKFVSEKASDKAFGARPLRRFIQEKVEETIARQLLEGKIKKGTKVVLSPEQLV